MFKLYQIVVFYFAISTFSIISFGEENNGDGTFRIKQHGEGVKALGAGRSEVSISVGEKPGFLYTVNGYTYSDQRIGASGDYFNDEFNFYGYANLFVVAEPDVFYYEIKPVGNELRVYIVNSFQDEFFYQILVPNAVSVYHDLRIGQFNLTSLVISGPSRSALHYPRVNTIKNKVFGSIKLGDGF